MQLCLKHAIPWNYVETASMWCRHMWEGVHMQAVSQLRLLRRLLDLSGWRTDVRCNDRACISIFCLAPLWLA